MSAVHVSARRIPRSAWVARWAALIAAGAVALYATHRRLNAGGEQSAQRCVVAGDVESIRPEVLERLVVHEGVVVGLVAQAVPCHGIVVPLDDGCDRTAAEAAAFSAQIEWSPAIRQRRVFHPEQLHDRLRRKARGPVRHQHGNVVIGKVSQPDAGRDERAEQPVTHPEVEEAPFGVLPSAIKHAARPERRP
jgi:hypothetical protein